VRSCGRNAGSQLTLVNGVDVGTEEGGLGGVSLFVNAGTYDEKSNFAIAEVVVWPRGLTDDEVRGVSEHLMNRRMQRSPTFTTEPRVGKGRSRGLILTKVELHGLWH